MMTCRSSTLASIRRTPSKTLPGRVRIVMMAKSVVIERSLLRSWLGISRRIHDDQHAHQRNDCTDKIKLIRSDFIHSPTPQKGE
jgi:hypothetical protein